jgi:hypothetical protein
VPSAAVETITPNDRGYGRAQTMTRHMRCVSARKDECLVFYADIVKQSSEKGLGSMQADAQLHTRSDRQLVAHTDD